MDRRTDEIVSGLVVDCKTDWVCGTRSRDLDQENESQESGLNGWGYLKDKKVVPQEAKLSQKGRDLNRSRQ